MRHLLLTAVAVLLVAMTTHAADTIVDSWRYSLEAPADGWQKSEFDDEDGFGGFGSRGTPGARIGTEWTSREIWLRKSFELTTIPTKPVLLVHHDDEAEVYLNGQLVKSFVRWTSESIAVPLDDKGTATLRKGQNSITVHCHQDAGRQFVDVHVVDADIRSFVMLHAV